MSDDRERALPRDSGPEGIIPPNPVVISGPISHANWVASEIQGPVSSGDESALYSDTSFVGEVRDGIGPYTIFNMVHLNAPQGQLWPALVLRADWYVEHVFDHRLKKTDDSDFTGGTLADEIAAVLALATGARLAAGGQTRHFDGRDPRGKPSDDRYRPPGLPPVRGRAILPSIHGTKQLSGDMLVLYRRLTSRDAVALVRAARAYRDALWIADAHPEMSWLLMVSALEAAAGHEAGEVEPEVRLREVAPRLAAELDDISTAVTERAAPYVAQLFKPTGRFIKFMIRFMPDEPARRPPHGAIKWTKSALKEALSTVYDKRSKALHCAIPIPPPMCEPPVEFDGTYSERDSGLAVHMTGGTWMADDLPMNLYMFEYLTRGALLRWWQHRASMNGVVSEKST